MLGYCVQFANSSPFTRLKCPVLLVASCRRFVSAIPAIKASAFSHTNPDCTCVFHCLLLWA